MIGKDGSDIFAVFESTGELISCRVINKNAPPPKVVMAAIEKGQYEENPLFHNKWRNLKR